VLSAILLIAPVSGLILPTQNAAAQGVTITTSADSHGGAFFGEGVIQVVINDPDADDDDVQEDISVEIDADPSVGADVSHTFTIYETAESSGRFEFFLMHDDADDISAAELDSINTNGAFEHHALSTPPDAQASVIRFGDGEELPVSTELFEDVSFGITVGDEEVTVDYEESSAELEVDRSTYGSDSFVHLFIIDQDGNLNPTEADDFILTAAELNTLLFDIDGAAFDDDLFFDESGDNTARFEGIAQLRDAASAATEELIFSNEAVEITLNDIADYGTPDDVTGSTDSSSRSFDIDDEDGELDDVAMLTFGSEFKLTLNDNDRNRDSDDGEMLDDVVRVSVDEVGGDLEVLDMEETDDNTGIFIIDLSNNELQVTFLADGELPSIGNDILELRKSDITKDAIVEYNDTRDDDGNASITSSMTLEITLASGAINLPATAGINEEFLMTLAEADLNDNPRVKDSYTFVLNQAGPYNLTRSGDQLGNLASLEFELEGDPLDFGTQNVAYTLVENDVNSGVFTVLIEMSDIVNFGNDGGPLDVDNDDVLKATYNDMTDDVTRESVDQMTIGKADVPDEEGSCMGLTATIVGTEGNDILNGTAGPDIIAGLRGNDVINGLGGNDIVCGGLGMDQLKGGDGDDKLLGGNENDIINGDGGNDSAWGGTGWDQLFGSFGNDTLRGGIGNDRLAGGDGNDRLFGQEGFDRLDGGAGNNLIVQD
jgi:Ca2+-binding RTX toxin-like protein